LFVPITTLPSALQVVSHFVPLTYAVSLLRGIWVGDAWSAHLGDVAALVACVWRMHGAVVAPVSLGMTMMPESSFTADWSSARIVFGAGAVARLPGEVDALGWSRVLIVTTPGRTAELGIVRAHLASRVLGLCDVAALHVPIDRVTAALAVVDQSKPDALLAVGGGSAIGLAESDRA
jgi:hypothetical protein